MENLEQQLQQLRLIHNRITCSNNEQTTQTTTGEITKTTLPITTNKLGAGAAYKNHYGLTTKKQHNIDTLGTSCVSVKEAAAQWNNGKKLTTTTQSSSSSLLSSLDNPIVLDQQLEALAHHKRQMEKRGLLQQQQKPLQQQQPLQQQLQLQQQQPFKQPSKLLIYNNQDNNDQDNDDDRETSPPSPVSSSYSELRHAATALKPSQLQQQQQHIYQQQQQHAHHHNIVGGFNGGTYMNVAYGPNSCYSPMPMAAVNTINHDSTDYYDFGNFSQSSSTYESIYEPINPRPSSQMSNSSSLLLSSSTNTNNNHRHHNNNNNNGNMSSYANIMSNSSSTITLNSNNGVGGPTTTTTTNKHHHHHNNNNTLLSSSSCCSSSNYNDDDDDNDNDVVGNRECGYDTEDTLTDYLDNTSIDYNNDNENYGICCKCNERVIGENSGCTAMEKIYHIECFTCTQCQINLQGKPFYAIDNKAYCEYDYLQTLEKCSVCTKPILERILRATGKPYHPQCFTCIVCGKSLDGIQFTVDATNQNYCITDFHKKFAPRCCVCKSPIMPESGEEETVRVVALDRSFHLKCYKCEDCGLLLSSNSEGSGCYPLDDHVLCKSCNAKRVQILTSSSDL